MNTPESTEDAPTSFVVFGATGDLSQRKLLPALFNLYMAGLLPQQFKVMGVSRDDLSRDAFIEFARKTIRKKVEHGSSPLDSFLGHLDYQYGLFEDGATYLSLSQKLIEIEKKEFGGCSNKLFYLAVPPPVYSTVFTQLAHSGLTIPCGGADGWTRVLVEKPFGHNLETAQELDTLLGLLFKEEQIFRIDHYLAKETLQNILAFRFSNALFEPLWNNTYIDKVEIKTYETAGIGERGLFYEDIGALRDVGQNHLLQMLALVAMDEPALLEAQAIRAERAKVLEALEPLTTETVKSKTIRGQYEGYRGEAHVASSSEVETYFKVEASIATPRWQGVPFILESGKKLHEDKVEITIFFKETASSIAHMDADEHHQNILTFRIQPEEGISLVFWAKKPGFGMDLEGKKLSFSYQDSDAAILPDAYEHVLYDCIRGDQTRFTSTAEVRAAWKFITPILAAWPATALHSYTPGAHAVAAKAI